MGSKHWMRYISPPPKQRRSPSKLVVSIVVTGVSFGVAFAGVKRAVELLTAPDKPATEAAGRQAKKPAKKPVPAPQAPPSVGSSPRLGTPYALEMARTLRGKVPASVDVQVGLYGTPTLPRYALIATSPLADSSRVVFDDLVAGMGADAGQVGPPTRMAGGLTCATHTLANRPGSLCAWGGSRSNGVLAWYTGDHLPTLAKTTAAARADVEGR